ncbi:hypothetical protein I550_1835 [Mycobacterium intracellulare 1956]|uniref:Uncharacterized protein n=1 Tax=Mycobacterium intracellulare 1956 TaxID=1299331 RepID=X8CQL8_MYCIT|nr:hypothetical protein I550_1835 [Mycobacterium intracellulare 1956]
MESQLSDWQFPHIGRGGTRNVLQSVQRWISSLWSLRPDQKNSVSGLIDGASLVAISFPS